MLDKDPFGERRIMDVKTSEAKLWLISLQQGGRGYSSIHTIRGVLRPAFQMAVEDDIIIKNPFDFQLSNVIINDSVARVALTPKQQEAFLEFVKNDKHFKKYYHGIFVLFHTGLRISEFCGLTVKDIDLKTNIIQVKHQLQRLTDMQYHIVDTKTTAGTRILPITAEVAESLKHIIETRPKLKPEPIIDGYKGFLFYDENGNPMVALHWENYFKHIRLKYNNYHEEPLPKITPHVCRHTYCTNMARAGMNPKALQYLMGHSEVDVTMNTYTHINYDDAKEELERVLKKL